MNAAPLIRHVTVSGTVQGVGYRAFVEGQVLAHGLEGWVRNRRNGTVEAVFCGGAMAVEAVIAACQRGPPAAVVGNLEVADAPESLMQLRRPGELFSTLPTV